MKWIKKGLIYKPEKKYAWMLSHAQLPTVDKISEEILRIYYGTRDNQNRTVTTYIEVEADNPNNILYIHDKPVLRLGELGCFDDSGAMPSWIINHGGLKYLYYIGWNACVSVSYRNSIGLAVSDDDGLTFHRLFKGPIVDRTLHEPHFCGATCVIIDGNLWHMYYLSCTHWIIEEGKPEPIYHIKYAESSDGIHWDRRGIVAIDFKSQDEGGITRPCVIREADKYLMWYCYRGKRDYRTNPKNSYRIGHAESTDGIHWNRQDERVGISISEEGWDSIMITYAHVYIHKGSMHMIYNGNGFGETGFGYAIME